MKVGFFSPLPPARTGIADYSAQLLRALRPMGEVLVNAPGDISLYHLGNNQLHQEIYRRALEIPGVVVLHDAVLQHFFLGKLNERQYIEEFTYNYGGWSEDQARDLWRRRARSASDDRYFRYPMLKRIAERSRAVIVHNPRAAEMVKEHVPNALVFEIPHLFEPPAEFPAGYDVIRLRDQLGVPPRTLLLAIFGHLRESKRLANVLRAFQQARPSAEMMLLVAGDFVSSDLTRAMQGQLTAEAGVLRVGFTPEQDFWRYAAACDACVNLRYPSAGETSGISIRLMGIGKPVLITAGAETSRIPESACLRVDSGVAEEEMLAAYMGWLARRPEDARAIGARAAAHIQEFHAPERVAAKYWQALERCYHRN